MTTEPAEFTRTVRRLSYVFGRFAQAADSAAGAVSRFSESIPPEDELLREYLSALPNPTEGLVQEYFDIKAANPDWGYLDALAEFARRHPLNCRLPTADC